MYPSISNDARLLKRLASATLPIPVDSIWNHDTMRASARPLAAAGLVLALSACAFGTRQPTLVYPPAADAPATAAAASPKSLPIVLQPFTDARKDKSKVGTVRNGFGMPTADVVPTNSVTDWFNGALKTELRKSGYTVLAAPDAGKPFAVLSGQIRNVWADMYFNYNGEIAFDAQLKQGGKDVLARHYEGDGSAGVAWGATAESYAQTLAIALANTLKSFIADLDGAEPSASAMPPR